MTERRDFEACKPAQGSEHVGAADEVAEIVAELTRLRDRASMPVVRACLEEASKDIAYLTSTDDIPLE